MAIVSSIQMVSEPYEVRANLDQATHFIKDAVRNHSDLILLPEVFNTGYRYEKRLGDCAEELDGRTVSWMKQLSLVHGCCIGGGIIERSGDTLYNTFVLAEPTGIVHTYRKRHLPFFENLYFKTGNEPGIFDTCMGRVGVLVCWDMIFKKTVNELKDKVDILLVSSCWPDMTTGNIPVLGMQNWITKQCMNRPQQIAQELSVPVVFANHTGNFDTPIPYLGLRYRSQFVGNSGIIDSDGFALRQLPWGSSVISAEFSLPNVIRREYSA